MGVTIREKKKGSGIWWVFIHHQGNRKSVKVGAKKAANKVKTGIEAELKAGQLGLLQDKKDKLLFKDCSDTWSNDVLPATCKNSTVSEYRSILKKHLLPKFGNCPIDEITKIQVKSFLLAKIKSGLSKSTVNHMKSAMSGVFTVAMDAEMIDRAPTSDLKLKLFNKNKKPPIDPLNREELAVLLGTFKRYRPDHYVLALLLARTGMRVGEAIALKWGDVDFNGRFIHVQRGFVRMKITDTTKNHKDRRVDMSNQLSEALRKRKVQQAELALKDGITDVEWIFPTNTWKTPVSQDNWRQRVFNPMLSKAGLRKVRIHDLRHTYASLLIQAGEYLPYIRDQLGHHSISITVDTYGHLEPGGNKDAVNKLDDSHPSAPLAHPDKKSG